MFSKTTIISTRLSCPSSTGLIDGEVMTGFRCKRSHDPSLAGDPVSGSFILNRKKGSQKIPIRDPLN